MCFLSSKLVLLDCHPIGTLEYRTHFHRVTHSRISSRDTLEDPHTVCQTRSMVHGGHWMVPLCASRHRTLTRCSIWPLSKKPLPLYLARFCATTFELSLRLWRENELALPESTSANSSVNQITLLGKQCNAWRSRKTNFFFLSSKNFPVYYHSVYRRRAAIAFSSSSPSAFIRQFLPILA